MRIFTLTVTPIVRLRTWALAALMFTMGSASAVASTGPHYSTAGDYSQYTPYFRAPITGIETGVENPERAADAALDNYAVINTFLSIANSASLRLGLNGPGGAAGDRVGMAVGNAGTVGNPLNLSAVSVITLTTYSGTQLQETRVVSAEVAKDILLGGTRPTQLEFVAKLPFTHVQINVGGLLTASFKLKVYYAYAVPSLVQPQARGIVSQFSATGAGLAQYYGAGTSNTGVLSACVGAGVNNPERAVDNDLTNYSTFSSVVSVACPAALSVKLAGSLDAPGGYYAGFVIGNDDLLDLSILAGLRLTTYRDGQPTGESATGADLLELHVLPDGKYQVSFRTNLPFDEVKIERIGLVSVLDDLKLYYGFGVEPHAFEGSTHVLSDNDPTKPTFASTYEVRTQAGVCVSINGSCGVTNPAGAADNDPNTFATLALPTAALSVVELKLALNGTGTAGNRAGMVVGDGGGLLDASALDQFTLTTYDENGHMLESASGSSLLALNLLPNGQHEISFLTTQPFKSVQLTAKSGASLLTTLPIYGAFADDKTGGLPSLFVPLPVQLTTFGAKWANNGADVTWTTASEKNSDYFVVERTTGADAPFVAVGRVNAAGSSSSTLSYKLRDAEAGALGVAVLYYRLRQVDRDGSAVLSPVASLAVGKGAVAAPQLEVYPNPAASADAVLVHCPNLPVTGGLVQAYSQLGQLAGELAVPNAAAQVALPTLAPGLYHVVLRDAAGQTLATQRLVVGTR
ncbi:T9SS type A sorting domain-containing protein [Hymenobacter ruricola]|uniref:T9SS type A sorting domain-containing protein n=1 Tax=Hymenobacter ruricola TaxID=2791023 RepID=A0ABS0HZE8_9BACT|nr:T9SS type A sorting domain-containing protein [Hymenobacter ruricola]MBF9219722.1 T9SS type A sorting domain-containing protein [Hymenobacter ruricola]